DNIIGVKGVGEKTATLLIQEFGTVEEIYTKLKKDTKQFEKKGIKPRIIGLLEENEEEALFSKMLGQIRLDVPITYSLPKKEWKDGLSLPDVLDLFADLGFRTLSQRVKTLFGVVDESIEDTAEEEVVDETELKKMSLALWLLRSDITSPTLDDILQFTRVKHFEDAKKILLQEIKKQKLTKVYEEIELPLIPVIEKIEKRGIAIDLPYLKKLSKEYHSELAKREKRIWKHAGGEFNINSPKQLGEVLFEKLALSVKNQKKTSTGQKSTRESELEKMRDLHPIIEDILEYRELQKLLSTYIDTIPDVVDKGGRLHTEFLQSGTTTGRMASQNPNLQNIPIRTERGKNIRNAFIATKGFALVSLDYSQIELRVAAFLSGDKRLIDIFKRGEDVHAAVASEVFGVPEKEVTEEMRRRAKAINFGIHYGMGVNALRQALGTTRAEAQQFYNEYFKKFSGLERYLTDIKAETAKSGYTETYFGRRRHFEGINSSLPYIKAQAERMAINAPIQGTQADIIKIAMARIDEYLVHRKFESDAYLLLQVHDELVYEIKKDRIDEITLKIKEIMEGVLSPKEIKGIPLIVDVAVGDNWGNMKKLV
ncbi:hypothetical protein IIA94_02980, partial [Patescibacteria group bacterium]|nr:hypothetical protein [Patescibacteria group bacterium]